MILRAWERSFVVLVEVRCLLNLYRIQMPTGLKAFIVLGDIDFIDLVESNGSSSAHHLEDSYLAHIAQLHFKYIGSSRFEQSGSALFGLDQLHSFRLSLISEDGDEHSGISSSIDVWTSDDRDEINLLTWKKRGWCPTHGSFELPFFPSSGSRSMYAVLFSSRNQPSALKLNEGYSFLEPVNEDELRVMFIVLLNLNLVQKPFLTFAGSIVTDIDLLDLAKNESSSWFLSELHLLCRHPPLSDRTAIDYFEWTFLRCHLESSATPTGTWWFLHRRYKVSHWSQSPPVPFPQWLDKQHLCERIDIS